ncbi:MAG: MoaD/ThiS family protein [Paracoccaceae bacterium]|jgi:molybdopterin synthase sulfur carrier subunit
MVDVNLWSGLRRFADGQTVVSVEAQTVRQMLAALTETHPGLEPVIKAGVSISINGVIETNLSAALPPDAEVYLIQRVKGG